MLTLRKNSLHYPLLRMKPSYFVSRLLRPVFAAAIAFTCAAPAAWATSSDTVKGINNTSGETIDSISDAINVEADSYAYGVYNEGTATGDGYVDATIGKITSTITSSAVTDRAYGIYNDGKIDEIDITAESFGAGEDAETYSIKVTSSSGLVRAIQNNGSIGDINAVILAEGSSVTHGILNLASTSKIDSIAGSVSATSTASYVRAIENYGTITSITSDIFAQGSSTAHGIYNYSNATITTIDARISATSTSNYARAIDTSGYIGSIAGTISATAKSSAVSIYVGSKGSIDDIYATLTSTSTGGNAYGILNSGDIGNVSITAQSFGEGEDAETYSIKTTSASGTAYAICNYGEIDDIEASIIATAYGYAQGIRNEGGSIEDVTVSITATSTNDSAHGIYNYDNSSIGDISGSISAESSVSTGWAVGIANYSGCSIDSVDATISAIANKYSARGLDNGGTIGNIAGSVTVSSYSTAAGINNSSGAEMGVISALVNANSDTDTAYGINNSGTLAGVNIAAQTVGDDYYSIKVTSTGSAYGLYNDAAGTIVSEEGTSVNAVILVDAASSYAIENQGEISSITGSLTSIGTTAAYGLANYQNASIAAVDVSIYATASASSSTADAVRAIDNGGTIGTIAGDISAIGTSSSAAVGIANMSGGDLGTISATITASSENSYAYGIYNTSTIDSIDIESGEVAESYSIKVVAADEAIAIYNTGSIRNGINADIIAEGGYAYGIQSTATIGDIAGSITATATSDAYGIWSGSGSTTGIVTADITASASGSIAHGIQNNGIMGNIDSTIVATGTGTSTLAYSVINNLTMGNIAGSLTASAMSTAYGIYNESTGSIDDVTATITATSDTDKAYGIQNFGEIDDITTTEITVNAAKAAFGLYNSSSADMGNVNATITAESSDSYAYGIYNFNKSAIGVIEGSITTTAGVTGSGAYGIGNYSYCTITSIDADIVATSNNSVATAIDNWGTIGDIAGSLTAEAVSTATGIDNFSSGSIQDISADISATSAADIAYGILNEGKIEGTVTGAITAISYAADTTGISKADDEIIYTTAYGINNSGTMSDIDATIIATSYASDADATGIENSGTIAQISGDITVSGSYQAYGITNFGSITGDVSASISSSATDNMAYGIYNFGCMGEISATIDSSSTNNMAAGIVIYENASAGDITGKITAEAYSAAFGIINEGAIGDITATITSTSTADDANGLYITAGSTTGTIYSSIMAVAEGDGMAYGIYTKSTDALSFGDGASVTATSGAGGDSAFSIFSTAGSLTLASEGTVALNGHVYLLATEGETSLTVRDGTVALSAGSTITASTITINEGATLSLVVMGSDTITAESVTGTGSLSLSAGVDLDAATYYFTSYSEDKDYAVVSNDINVTTYGGSLVNNVFTVSAAQTLTLDGDDLETGVTLTTDNARVEVSSSSTTPEAESTTIMMNFSTTGVDAENSIKVYAVTTVTELTEISFTTTTEDSTTATTVTQLDQSFAEYVKEFTGSDYSIEVAEAYHVDVAGLNAAAGDSVEVIFDVGEGYEDATITVYHLGDTAESWDDATTITNFTYDGQYLTAYVTGFSTVSYSIVTMAEEDVIPEPSTATLSLLALAALCARRKRRAVRS